MVENIEYLCNISMWKNFLEKTQNIEPEIGKFDDTKIKKKKKTKNPLCLT